MVANRSRSKASGKQLSTKLYPHQHAIHVRASHRRADAPRPAREPPALDDPAPLGTAVHPHACSSATDLPEHSTCGIGPWLHGASAAASDARGPASRHTPRASPPPELDTRSLAWRTELRRACHARGIDYSICDELHVLEDRLAQDESAQQQHGASASAALAQRASPPPPPESPAHAKPVLDRQRSSACTTLLDPQHEPANALVHGAVPPPEYDARNLDGEGAPSVLPDDFLDTAWTEDVEDEHDPEEEPYERGCIFGFTLGWGTYDAPATHDWVSSWLDGGGNVSAMTKRGQTMLHWAVVFRDLELVHALMRAGADPHAARGTDYPPLKSASTWEEGQHAMNEYIALSVRSQTTLNVKPTLGLARARSPMTVLEHATQPEPVPPPPPAPVPKPPPAPPPTASSRRRRRRLAHPEPSPVLANEALPLLQPQPAPAPPLESAPAAPLVSPQQPLARPGRRLAAPPSAPRPPVGTCGRSVLSGPWGSRDGVQPRPR